MATTLCTSSVTISDRSAALPELSRINTSNVASVIPNKHIPYCSPGPQPSPRHLESSPLLEDSSTVHANLAPSLTFPPSAYHKTCRDPPVYAISAEQVTQILHHASSQPLPAAHQVFPWLHGLHADNQLQLAFFTARKRALCRTPKCIRGLTVVKTGGNLSHSKLKGALAPEELLKPFNSSPSSTHSPSTEFIDIDPRDGFGVRNFQIQACKMATVSDIIIYRDDQTSQSDAEDLARRVSSAQAAWQKKMEGTTAKRLFNTFIVTDDFNILETNHHSIVSIDATGRTTGNIMDFFHWERMEMCTMSNPAEICHNVWLGPSPDPSLDIDFVRDLDFGLMIEASDVAQLPDATTFKVMENLLRKRDRAELGPHTIPQMEFPGSGSILPPSWSHTEADGLLTMCEWLYKQAQYGNSMGLAERRDSKLESDDGEDSVMLDAESKARRQGRRILIHCADGYTESSLLGLAYYMFAECKTAHQAWIDLHRVKGRNFFAYGSDVALLRAIQPRLMQASPRHVGSLHDLCMAAPAWLDKMDGSLPSRILDYMYLGNLSHANNPDMLKELGIGQVLSVGEPVTWSKDVWQSWSQDKLLYIDRVQDNGVDPLTEEFPRCLDFIEKGRKEGTATLVHCRVGVSRSATICIAEVMKELGLSFPRAYCFVRARRLNVIIQPHLRFSYELLKWEEQQCEQRGVPIKRELEWATIAREIAAMNKPYSRQDSKSGA